MKKYLSKLSLSMIIIVLIAVTLSCNKTTVTNQPTSMVQTTTRNISVDSNSIILSDAIKIAQGFLRDVSHNSSVSIANAFTIEKNGVPYIHVVNANNNKGFVILSADSFYTPILAYNTKGDFSVSNKYLNTGLRQWFNRHGVSIDFIKNSKTAYTDSLALINKSLWQELGYKYNNGVNKKESFSFTTNDSNNQRGQLRTNSYAPGDPTVVLTSTTTYTTAIGPLTGVAWDQGSPFNIYCPTSDWVGKSAPQNDGYYNGHWLAGCGPVAVAQVMNYWQTPAANYNWAQMKAANLYSTTDPGTQQIAHLMAKIGSDAGSVYNFIDIPIFYGGTSETLTDDTNFPSLFNSYGYSSAQRTTGRDAQKYNPINGVAYSDLLVTEILSYRPCIITSSTGQTNLFLGLIYVPYADMHIWVCEGDQRFTTEQTWQNIYYNNDGSGSINHIHNYTTYDNVDYLYMNWGWRGKDNGFFYNSTVDYTQPNVVSGVSDPNQCGFPDFQTVIYNIHP